MPELLLPAGNFEKLKAAILYGADAVYLAGSAFGMRAAADNFSLDELNDAFHYAHTRGVKAYITVNTTPHWNEYAALETYLHSLAEIGGADALIVADIGVMTLARSILPDTPIHISTQAGAVSHADCSAWHSLGASRVVLARELSFEEIYSIRERIPAALEIEVFIHGSMCVSYSGRCLLSSHFTGRDANRGMCTQPCRWKYRLYEIEEEKRPDMRLPIMETEHGSFIMSAKDLCMIQHIPALMESGVSSFKIEGRMKSAYYAAVTANVYRMAIDAYSAAPSAYSFRNEWMHELNSVSHREYCTGYFFDSPLANAQLCENTETGYIREKSYLAVVADYDEASGTARLIQRNKVRAGDAVEIISPGQTGKAFIAADLKNQNGELIEAAPHPSMLFSMRIPFPVKEGDILRGK